ncbi:MAG: nicotinate phosphoribosyltransferase, partial [Bacteroidales bacterium]
TPLLSIMNHQMAVATKASRVTRATPKPVSEFGSRRAHGPWAAVYGGKAAFIGGCLNSSNITTGNIFDIPSSGTMAHSFVNAFGCTIESELKAFIAYIKSHRGEPLTLLVDTYDTLKSGIGNAIAAFKEEGIDDSYTNSYGIRLDSGDLTYLSQKCRLELDKAGLTKCKIFATNALDEYLIAELERQDAQIDAYGVGDAIATSKHNPCFGNVYKLVEIGGEAVLKRSEEKSKLINPGFQRSYRIIVNNVFKGDVTTLEGDSLAQKIENGEDIVIRHEWDETKITKFKGGEYSFRMLQKKVMERGEIVTTFKPLMERRDYYLNNLASFNPTQVRIINPHFYKVNISDDLYNLKSKIINSLIEEIKRINGNEK